jgi:hypothetical protein
MAAGTCAAATEKSTQQRPPIPLPKGLETSTSELDLTYR